MTVDPKQIRVKCPTCDYPLRLEVTICHVCGNRVVPEEQWLRYTTTSTHI